MKELVKKSREQGMITFDDAIFEFIKAGEVTVEEGMRNADSVNDLRLKLKLAEGGDLTGEDPNANKDLSLKDADDDSYKLAS